MKVTRGVKDSVVDGPKSAGFRVGRVSSANTRRTGLCITGISSEGASVMGLTGSGVGGSTGPTKTSVMLKGI